MTLPHELNDRLIAAATDLKDGHRLLETRVQESARADHVWRVERAKAYAMTSGTVAERDAKVELETGDLRYAAKLAEDLRVAALESVRSRRGVLSAIQSMVALSRSEMDFAKYGPAEGAA